MAARFWVNEAKTIVGGTHWSNGVEPFLFVVGLLVVIGGTWGILRVRKKRKQKGM
ncbi:hypothetical protein [Aneurinibacillus terranovensis]|uniref:hypothetical protein n=1 Tax=Aneurinibacillus terranovensis TaxID=278991 RepID=UPI0003FCCEDB|nr:hypothetical protein [Aneurinibacillus terranovensis]